MRNNLLKLRSFNLLWNRPLKMAGFLNKMTICPTIIMVVLLVFTMIHPTVGTPASTTVTTATTTATMTITVSTSTTQTITATVVSSTAWPTTGSVPNVTSTYSGDLSISSPTFNRPHGTAGYNYYYQAIRISTLVSGGYNLRSRSSIDTYGCLYSQIFYPSSPSVNLIACDDDSGGDEQFSIYNTLMRNNVYVLVVTTFGSYTTGSYSVIATGPSTVDMSSIIPSSTVVPPSTTSVSPIVSNYSNSLSYSSGTYVRPYASLSDSYYYQAIQVYTYTTSQYNFRSSSSIDTYGCFYTDYFDPSYPYTNLVLCNDDDGGDRQFSINATLYNGQISVLVVTTYSSLTRGDYSVLATGPATVYMYSITPTTMVSSTTSATPSSYSDSLDYTSGTFVRPYGSSGYTYYYEAIQVSTYVAGQYSFRSSGSLNAYGCLYSGYFDPLSAYTSLIACSYNTAGSGQFLLNGSLPYATSYILVVTTFNADSTGYFTITATGPGTVYMYKTTPLTTTTRSSTITSTFTGTLNSNNGIFARPYGSSSEDYYYQAIQLTISLSDFYSFTSISSMDTYGCLYRYRFDPSNPTYNLIECNDDGAGDRQFLITQYLNTYTAYILVVTTYGIDITGDFTVQATGSASVGMTPISPSGSNGTLNIVEIIAISIACSIIMFIIIGVCACRRKRRTLERQRLLPSNCNVNVHQVRNASQYTGNGSPFTVIPCTSPPPLVEEAPPSYETFMAQTTPSEQTET